MPIYEYQCPKCGRFEVLQKMSEDAVTVHDSCGLPVTRLISAGSFSFKGTGFYATDYARKDKKKGDSHKDKGESDKAAKTDKPKSDACATCPASDKSGDCKAA